MILSNIFTHQRDVCLFVLCICIFMYLFVFTFEAKCIFVRHVFGVKCDRCAAHLNLGHFSADYFTAGLRSAKEEREPDVCIKYIFTRGL